MVRVTGVHHDPLVLLIPLQLPPGERHVISERGQGAAGVGMGPRRALGSLAAHLDGPGALRAIGSFIDERTADDIHLRQALSRQSAGPVLDQELRPVTLGDDLVAEPYPDPAAGRLNKRLRRLEAGHGVPIRYQPRFNPMRGTDGAVGHRPARTRNDAKCPTPA